MGVWLIRMVLWSLIAMSVWGSVVDRIVTQLRETGGKEIVHKAVEKVVKRTGTMIVGTGSHITGAFDPRKSDFDFTMRMIKGDRSRMINSWKRGREVFRQQIRQLTYKKMMNMAKKRIKDPTKLAKLKSEISRKASQFADDLLSRTNLYPPPQLMEGVEDTAQAVSRYKKLGAPPSLRYKNGEKLSEKAWEKGAEGLYGEGSKAYIQDYERRAGKVWYKDPASGRVKSGFTDLLHLQEGLGRYTVEGMAGTSRQWAKMAEEALEKGDYKSLMKYMERLHAHLSKARSLARISDPSATGLKEFADTYKRLEKKFRLPNGDIDVAKMKKAIGDLFDDPAYLKSAREAIENARTQSGLLKVLGHSDEMEQLFIRDLLEGRNSAARKFWRRLRGTLKHIPLEKILPAVFAAVDFRRSSGYALDKEMDRAYRTALEGSIAAVSGLGPAAAAMVTNLILDWAKERGYSYAVMTQDCEDLLGGIVSVTGWESVSSSGKGETDIDRLARGLVSERKVRDVIRTIVAKAESGKGNELEEVSRKKKTLLQKYCEEIIVGKWRAKRTRMLAEYLITLRQLQEAIESLTTVVEIDPETVLLGQGGGQSSAEVLAILETPNPTDLKRIASLARKAAEQIESLGGYRHLIRFLFQLRVQWSLDGERAGESRLVTELKSPMDRHTLRIDRPGRHRVKCRLTWSVRVANLSDEAGDREVKELHILDALWHWKLPGYYSRTVRGDPVRTYRKRLEFEIIQENTAFFEVRGEQRSPNIEIAGPSRLFPGETAKYRLRLGGNISPKGKISWSGVPVDSRESEALFRPHSPGVYTLYARYTPPGESNTTLTASKTVTVVDPTASGVDVRIDGPDELGVGTREIYRARLGGFDGLSPSRIDYHWSLGGRSGVKNRSRVRLTARRPGTYRLRLQIVYRTPEKSYLLGETEKTIRVVPSSVAEEIKMPTQNNNNEEKTAADTKKTDRKQRNTDREELPRDRTAAETGGREAATGSYDALRHLIQHYVEQKDCITLAEIDSAYRAAASGISGATRGTSLENNPEWSRAIEKTIHATPAQQEAFEAWLRSIHREVNRNLYRFFKKEVGAYLEEIRRLKLRHLSRIKGGVTGPQGACYEEIIRLWDREYKPMAEEYRRILEWLRPGRERDDAFICQGVTRFVKQYGIDDKLTIPQKFLKTCAGELQDDRSDSNESTKRSLEVTIVPSSDRNILPGETVRLRARISGGRPPYRYDWSGNVASGKGADADFIASKPGEYTVTLRVSDSGGLTRTATKVIRVEGFGGTITVRHTPPGPVMVGQHVALHARVDGVRNLRLGFLWEPHESVEFDNRERATTGARFYRTGRQKVWVRVFRLEGDVWKRLGESPDYPIDVVAPPLKLTVARRPRIGEEGLVRLTIEGHPPMKRLRIRWESRGKLSFAVATEDDLGYRFVPVGENPVTITAILENDRGDELDRRSLTVTPEKFRVRLQRSAGPSRPEPYRQIALKVLVSPTPENGPLRYRWIVNEGTHIGSGGLGDEASVYRSSAGTGVVRVEVYDRHGVRLGTGSFRFRVVNPAIANKEKSSDTKATRSPEGRKNAESKKQSRNTRTPQTIQETETEKERQARRHRQNAEEKERAGDLNGAVNELQKSLTILPDPATHTRMERLKQKRDYVKSLRSASRKAWKEGRFDRAAELGRKLTKLNPGNRKDREWSERIAREKARIDAAIDRAVASIRNGDAGKAKRILADLPPEARNYPRYRRTAAIVETHRSRNTGTSAPHTESEASEDGSGKRTNRSSSAHTGHSDFTGVWNTRWGRVHLTQTGDTVTGYYEHDGGRIVGIVRGNTLYGSWREAPSYKPPSDAGKLEFTLSPDGRSFTGRWKYGFGEGAWREDWHGSRHGSASPGTPERKESTSTHPGSKPVRVVAEGSWRESLEEGGPANLTIRVRLSFWNVGSRKKGYGEAIAESWESLSGDPEVEYSRFVGTFSGGPNGIFRFRDPEEGTIVTFRLQEGRIVNVEGHPIPVKNPQAFRGM